MKALVVIVHGCNVGWLGPYGNEWVLTPTLDRLAAEGVVFDNHLADLPDPAESWRSIWSGRYQLPGAAASLAAARLVDLSEADGHGLRTVFVPDLRKPLPAELEAIWDVVAIPREAPLAERPIALAEAVEAALGELAGEERWLLAVETDRLLPPWHLSEDVFAAYADVCGPLLEEEGDESGTEPEELTPYEHPPSGLWGGGDQSDWWRLRASFASAVSQLDTELEALLESLGQDCLLIVTSSAGLPLGEHAMVGQARPWLNEETTHVPLLLRFPDGREAGRRVNHLTQPVDLLPTLLEWFGLPAAPGLHGSSLLPLASAGARAVRGYAVSAQTTGSESEAAIQSPEWKLILPTAGPADAGRSATLFAKPEDRWEVNDLRQRHLEWAEHLEQRLRSFLGTAGREGPLEAPALLPYEEFMKTLSPAPQGGAEEPPK